MDLLLWRWSTAVQVTSLLMIAAFFAVMARTSKRAELRWWALAWWANLAALSVTVFFWYLQPASFSVWLRASYVASKMAFAVLLLQGAWALTRPGSLIAPTRLMVGSLAAYGLVGGSLLATVELLGTVHHALLGVVLIAGMTAIAPQWRMFGWLALAIGLRGALALAESAAYWSQWSPGAVSPETTQLIGSFVSVTSSFDAGAEWFIALGCVLAMSDRAQRELAETNASLLAAHEDLRRLADRDPLTALDNRRALPEVFRSVHDTGAAVLFFDLDDFKQINDVHGHGMGDKCLTRFAAALRESFRPSDAVIRYGGDEFLVVAGGLDRASAVQRIESLRERLRFGERDSLPFGFSFGLAELRPGHDPEAALQAADDDMFRSKRAAKALRA
jgi:diguanylate cyclase (GGDEF)-like protein